MAKNVIKRVQDSTQEFDQEVEEVIRLGRYSEGGKRPMMVKMRSQVAVEEIMARKGKLADETDHKEIWIKKDMNLEEREKENPHGTLMNNIYFNCANIQLSTRFKELWLMWICIIQHCS
ncbi:hypothetical protein E2C01_084253 [Portunus trituberculatus]|uniref:Uncharacterized protein n=1 Tax=Portunus trituberculatus TaxID=210409 RepID=A0A5B7J4B4_PORTR|nr:hypothetical protein [Portunus trituberculatus]